MKLKVTVNGHVFDVDVEVEEEQPTTLQSLIGATSAYGVTPTAAKAPGASAQGLRAPISGTVLQIKVDEGQAVKSGDVLIVLEAMKMETEITAPNDGTVAAVDVSVGDAVQSGQMLIEWAA